MKKTAIYSLLAVILIACGTDDLAKKKEELKKAKAEQAKTNKTIAELEEAIAKLDTTQADLEYTPVSTKLLKEDAFNHYVEVHGIVEASKNIMASPEASGRITALKVKEGQRVSTGQILATIDYDIIQKNIQEVEKSLEFVNTIFKKQKSLYDKGVGTEVQFLEAKNQKETLEKKLSTLKNQQDKYMVRAPISGIVDQIMPKVGELASPQMPIMRIVNLDKVFVTADVSEALLGKVEKNDNVEVIFKSLNKTVGGKILQTGDVIDANNRTFRIKVELNEHSNMFKPNLLSTIKLNDYSNDKAIIIPTNTILKDTKNGAFVYVKEGDKGVKKNITTGVTYKGNVEALTGLNDGDQLITAGFKTLVDGELVKEEK